MHGKRGWGDGGARAGGGRAGSLTPQLVVGACVEVEPDAPHAGDRRENGTRLVAGR